MIEIDYLQENVMIMGMQGSGKTTLARRLLNAYDGARVIVAPQNPQGLYGDYAVPINSVKEITTRGAYLYVGELNEQVLEKICERMMDIGNMLLVIDDVHEFCKKQKIGTQFARLINSGRNQGISSIFISPAPNQVHNVILQSSRHFFAFRLQLANGIKWLKENCMGEDASILTPGVRRNKQLENMPDTDNLPKHHCLYTNTSLNYPLLLDQDLNQVNVQATQSQSEPEQIQPGQAPQTEPLAEPNPTQEQDNG